MTAISGVVRVRQVVIEQMLAEVRREPHLECCGLLAGRNEVIHSALPARNALASATAYEIAPRELFELFRRIRAEGLEHLGVYHSHPRGENAPSPSDLAAAFYPDASWFIVSPDANAPHPVRAFRIRDAAATELTIELVQD